MNDLYRILDANINRASEGIRVIEDISRFIFNDEVFTGKLKELRHKTRKIIEYLDDSMIKSRDAVNDTGKIISRNTTLDRKSSEKQIMVSNFKRVQEAFRSIEEMLKPLDNEMSKKYEILRFETYDLEKRCLNILAKQLPEGIYCITSEKHSNGRSNIEVVRQMIDAGIKIIQYREKAKIPKEMLSECKEIRKLTKNSGTCFIVNDHVDIALAVDADGVHIGQDDLPFTDIRKIAKDMIIGVSTHSPEQALKACQEGADYIGVGPIFHTDTKEDVCAPVGLGYLEWVTENINIPFVAIGGIKKHNIHEVVKRGAKLIALVTEIVSAADIPVTIKDIQDLISVNL